MEHDVAEGYRCSVQEGPKILRRFAMIAGSAVVGERPEPYIHDPFMVLLEELLCIHFGLHN